MSDDRSAYRRRQAAVSSYNGGAVVFQNTFQDGQPGYAEVYKNFDFTTTYKVQILNDSSYRGDTQKKKILMYPGDALYKGDIIHWKSTDDYWLVYGLDDQYDVNVKGLIKQCSDFLLKWYDGYVNLHTLPCVTEKYGGTGVDSSEVLTVLDTQITVSSQYDSTIEHGMRFLLGPQAYELTRIDRLGGKDNKYALYVMDATVSNSSDDFENGIADNPYNDRDWTIEVVDDSVSIDIEDTSQIVATVKLNTVEKEEEIVYTSSDPSIASVDSDGLIMGVAYGETTIRVALTGNTSIYEDVVVEVVEVIPDNIVITLSSSEAAVDNNALTITVYSDIGSDSTIDVSETNNGNPITTTFTPTITSGGSYASISSYTGASFVLHPITPGDAIVHIVDAESNSVDYGVLVRTLF